MSRSKNRAVALLPLLLCLPSCQKRSPAPVAEDEEIEWGALEESNLAFCQKPPLAEKASISLRFFAAGELRSSSLAEQVLRAQQIFAAHGIAINSNKGPKMQENSATVKRISDQLSLAQWVERTSTPGQMAVILLPTIPRLPSAAGLTFSPCLAVTQDALSVDLGFSVSDLAGPVVFLGAVALEKTAPEARYDVLAHEIGHGLGLEHVGGRENLLSPLRHTSCLPALREHELRKAHACLARDDNP